KKVDLLIKNGKIEEIAKNISSKYKTIEGDNLHVSAGWFDFNTNFRDPGYEYKEDVSSGLAAAAKGGFAMVCVSPDTNPPIDDKSGVEYLKNKSLSSVCSLSVMGALSKGLLGKDMAEMYDMKNSGAVLFGDGNRYLQNAGLMCKALQYAGGFGATIVNTPLDSNIAGTAEINEGLQSTIMGLKGIPNIAETIALARDISLLEYSNGSLHVANVTTAEGVDLIRKAKKKGLSITAGVGIVHLVKNDSALDGYKVNYKITPPLRSEKDRRGLIKGVLDGTIDIISSDHQPQDVEAKKVEFGYAEYGMIGTETFYGLYGKYLQKHIPLETFVKTITTNPYKIIKKEGGSIVENETASLTFFTPDQEWIFTEKSIVSKSKNSPFIEEILVGKVMGIVNENKTTL
ncbi:MAG: dihydroorotase, partial [Glaciecola sp.]